MKAQRAEVAGNVKAFLKTHRLFLTYSSLTLTLSPLPLTGGHGVSFAPSGNDNHRANWRPVGGLPENPQPDVNNQRQEAHELWR